MLLSNMQDEVVLWGFIVPIFIVSLFLIVGYAFQMWTDKKAGRHLEPKEESGEPTESHKTETTDNPKGRDGN